MIDFRAIQVRQAPLPLVADLEFEICEHKGIGHPDTIVDGACEAAALALAAAYQRTFGTVLHFNVDKGLLVAGQSVPRFGGGRLVKPIKLIICGRATSPGSEINVQEIVVGAATCYLEQNIRAAIEHFEIIPEIKEGSANLKQIYTGKNGIRLSNDTSFGVGHAPYSDLESRVLELSRILKSTEFRRAFPAAGDDFKIMGLRSTKAFAFTLAIAFIDRHIESASHYFQSKCDMHDYLAKEIPGDCVLRINTLDDSQARNADGLYLTVSGLSAEMGDDGQVGRGNRVNGLITPGRPMSLEAAAGKNPISHVGKIYNVLAHAMARAICAKVAEVSDASVQILSTIGQPIDQPQVILVDVAASRGLTFELRERVTVVAAAQLEAIGELTQRLARGELKVY